MSRSAGPEEQPDFNSDDATPPASRMHLVSSLPRPASKPLGQILVEEGVLEPSELDRLVELQQEQPESDRLPLGRLAVEMGYLSERKLRDLLDLHGKRLSLGELLVARGLIEQENVDAALEHQKRHGGLLGEILIEQELLDEISLTEVLAEQTDIPYVPLREDESWKRGLTTLVNASYAVRNGIVPISQIGRILTIAIWHPASIGLRSELEQSTGLIVRFVLDVRGAVQERIRNLYGLSADTVAAPAPVLATVGTDAPTIEASADGATAAGGEGPFASLGLDSDEGRALEALRRTGEGIFVVCGLTPSRVEELYLSLLRVSKAADSSKPAGDRPIEGRGELKSPLDASEAFREIPDGALRLAIVPGANTMGAMEWILDQNVSAERVANEVAGVLAVCSVRATCPTCAEEYRPHPLVLSEWFGPGKPPENARWRRGGGCEPCGGTGYAGERTVSELWVPSAQDREWISHQMAGHMATRRFRDEFLGRVAGLGQRALKLALQGETTLEEVLKVLPPQEVRAARKAA